MLPAFSGLTSRESVMQSFVQLMKFLKHMMLKYSKVPIFMSLSNHALCVLVLSVNSGSKMFSLVVPMNGLEAVDLFFG
jgi:hypothetical protein